MNLLDNIPGYREAVDQERQNRDVLFLAESLPIAGVPVRHMTPRHWILLNGFGNRFMSGQQPKADDVAIFLWVISPRYTHRPEDRAAFIGDTIIGRNFVETGLAIYRYLERTFWDAPGNVRSEKQYVAPVATIIDLMASEYGWTEESILEAPLGRIFQYLRVIERRRNAKCVQFNRSDRALSEALQKRMAATANN